MNEILANYDNSLNTTTNGTPLSKIKIKKRVSFKLSSPDKVPRKKESNKDITKTADLSAFQLSPTEKLRKMSTIGSSLKVFTINIERSKDGIRRDVFGNEIDKTEKKQKVTFIDKISNNQIGLIEIVNIEKFDKKVHNNKQADKTDESCDCACVIF
jgi:hypothetical protein